MTNRRELLKRWIGVAVVVLGMSGARAASATTDADTVLTRLGLDIAGMTN